jgi:hypothetical protein
MWIREPRPEIRLPIPGLRLLGVNLPPDQLDHLTGRGVPAQGLLGKDLVVSHADLEDPARGFHELDLSIRKRLPQLSRQTGGSGLVVSDDAVFDGDLHPWSPPQAIASDPAQS